MAKENLRQGWKPTRPFPPLITNVRPRSSAYVFSYWQSSQSKLAQEKRCAQVRRQVYRLLQLALKPFDPGNQSTFPVPDSLMDPWPRVYADTIMRKATPKGGFSTWTTEAY